MKRIKGVYFGYELIDGSKYSLVNVGCHYYKVLKMKKGEWSGTELRFTSLFDYMHYLETLEILYKKLEGNESGDI